jgi:hypothetical protein
MSLIKKLFSKLPDLFIIVIDPKRPAAPKASKKPKKNLDEIWAIK